MEEIKILQLITTLVSGGVQKVVLEYADKVRNYGIRFDYAVQGRGNNVIEQKVVGAGSEIFVFPEIKKHPILFTKKFYAFLKKHPEYKVVHVHQNFVNVIPLTVARFAGVKTRISHSHNSYNASSRFTMVLRSVISRFIYWNATDLWACSENAYQWLYKGKDKNKYILHNAVDCEKYTFNLEKRNTLRDVLGIDKQEFVCITVGTICNRKNQAFLIRLMAKKAANNRVKMLIVGEGEMQWELETQAKKLGLTNDILFLGDRADVPDLLSASDCFILASKSEGLPLSAVEAQINGLPCLLSSMITEEVSFSGKVHFLPINNTDLELWLNKIELLQQSHDSRNGLLRQVVCDSRFDIEREAKLLSLKYKELFER